MTQLGNQLRDLAEHTLPPAIDSGLFDRARRRSRLRKVAATITATAFAGKGFVLASGKSPAFTEAVGAPASRIGTLMGDGVVGWIGLAAVLAVSGSFGDGYRREGSLDGSWPSQPWARFLCWLRHRERRCGQS